MPILGSSVSLPSALLANVSQLNVGGPESSEEIKTSFCNWLYLTESLVSVLKCCVKVNFILPVMQWNWHF